MRRRSPIRLSPHWSSENSSEPRAWGARNGPPRLPLALAERANDLAAEGRQIVRVPRGDEIAVHHDLRVLPVAAGRDEVVLDREERRRLAALEDAGRDEHPARVADGGYDLALLPGLAHEAHHGVVPAHHVRRVAAWHDDRVELDGPHLLGLRVDVHGIAVLGRVGLDVAGTDDLHVRALLAQTVVRHPELHLLIHVLGENRDPLAFEPHEPSPQDLRDVWEKNVPTRGRSDRPPHSGHVAFPLSCSLIDIVRVTSFLHPSQKYSSMGMAILLPGRTVYG